MTTFVRYEVSEGVGASYGVVEHETIRQISASPLQEWSYTGVTVRLQDVKLLAPVEAVHIVGIGKNFVAAGDVKPDAPKLPIFFFKPLTSVIGPGEAIVIPEGTEEIKYESELAAVIGKTARNISEAEALDYVFGYTVANDLAALNYFHPDGHWTVGKSFDTFCPLGPALVTDLDLNTIRVQAVHNGALTQDSPLDLMITSVPSMIAYVSSFMTLQPGDVILTGTPAGAAMLKRGDTIECRIEGIGSLVNPVR